jgi:hypothetical protein
MSPVVVESAWSFQYRRRKKECEKAGIDVRKEQKGIRSDGGRKIAVRACGDRASDHHSCHHFSIWWAMIDFSDSRRTKWGAFFVCCSGASSHCLTHLSNSASTAPSKLRHARPSRLGRAGG